MIKNRIDIIYKNVDELIPYVNNPRHNENAVDAVASSIKNFGFKQPIVIDSKNEIVAGHTRLLASKKLGLEEVPVIIADDLTEAQVKAFRLADNKVSELASWDYELLETELEELSFTDINLHELGFIDESIDGFTLGDVEIEEPGLEIDDVITGVKRGDIFKLGRHYLMCGDSTTDDVDKLIPEDEIIDLYITDPPYNIGYDASEKRNGTGPAINTTRAKHKIENDKMASEDFESFLFQAFEKAKDKIKNGASFYIWYSPGSSVEFINASRRAGLDYRQIIIWNKSHFVIGRQDYQHKYEPCLYGYKLSDEYTQSDYQPIMYGWKPGEAHLWQNDRKQSDILNFNKPLASGIHPTMKPVELFDYLIKNSTKSGDKVFDSFAGSGTTLIACEENGRTAYCIEYEPFYVDAIIKRWEILTGEQAIKIN